MRIAPIEKPKGLFMRYVYYAVRRQIGKVITPVKVVYARVPRAAMVSRDLHLMCERGMTIAPELRFLITTFVAGINRCAFCVDISKAMALRNGLDVEKLKHLHAYRDSDLFTGPERAALAFVEAATRDKNVPDAVFNEAKKHFSDREIVEITLLNAVENYYNLINLPLEIESDSLCLIPARDMAGKVVQAPTV